MLYAMTATCIRSRRGWHLLDPPGTSPELTEARIYEAGVKHLFWDNRAEWTFSAYDIDPAQRLCVHSPTRSPLSPASVDTRGVEFAAAVRPFGGWKFWGNVAVTETRYKDFDIYTGNTPSNVAPLIVNAGGSRTAGTSGAGRSRSAPRCATSAAATSSRTISHAMEPCAPRRTCSPIVDIPGRDLNLPQLDKARVSFRVRNVTDKVYAAFSDPAIRTRSTSALRAPTRSATSFRW